MVAKRYLRLGLPKVGWLRLQAAVVRIADLTRAAARPRRAHDFDRASPSTSWKIPSFRPRLMWLPTYDSEVVEILRPVRSPMIAAVACMLVDPAEAQDIGNGRPLPPMTKALSPAT